jgi:uncharacterized protein
MRVVLDANVIVSASLSKFSVPFRALELVIDHHFPLISDKTFAELKTTLYKPKFDKYFLLEDTRPGIIATILKYSAIIIPTVTIKACRDPNDDMYLELALSGKANCIVSGDPDLKALNPFENIPIISPKEFLERYS